MQEEELKRFLTRAPLKEAVEIVINRVIPELGGKTLKEIALQEKTLPLEEKIEDFIERLFKQTV